MIKTFCDIQKEEITGLNVGKEDYIVEFREFKVRVQVEKYGQLHGGDLCLGCLLKMLNQKPKRKYVRKEKRFSLLQIVGKGGETNDEPVTTIIPELREMEGGLNSEGLTLLKPAKDPAKVKRKTRKLKAKLPSETHTEITDSVTENLSIHTPIPGVMDKYQVRIAGETVLDDTLKGTIQESLKKFDGKIPDCLNDYERKTVQGILDAGK